MECAEIWASEGYSIIKAVHTSTWIFRMLEKELFILCGVRRNGNDVGPASWSLRA